jgi:polyvinyl alcohol dehydrogenase (cytochrome)
MTTLNGFTFRNRNRHETRDAARRWVLGIVFTTLMVAPLIAQGPADWPMFGQNAANTGSNSTEANISAKNAYQLKTKWTFTTGGDVSARAAVVGGVAYFPDWGGNLSAVNANNGKLIWSHQLSDYGLAANTHSRTSPAVVNGVLYLGTQEGAYLLAINAVSGALIWKTELETPNVDPFAIVTTSPAVSGGTVYTGVASTEEAVAAFIPGFVCCHSRGSVVAVNAATGAIQWKTYTVPNTGYSGGGVWGSNPVVDAARKTIFIGTGNNYSKPTDPAYLDCINQGGFERTCLSPDDHVDSILALDMNSGALKWATRLVTWNQYGVTDGSDDWNVACFVSPFTNCPAAPTGPDYDFGSAPNEITYQTANGPKTIIGAGQKSGIYYALDPDSGAVQWQTQVGPGSSLGGMEWGSATDGNRIYVAIANFYGIPYGSGSAGSWAALDPATGAILWQRADPNGAVDIGPVAVANGVVYASSLAGSPATAPTMLAMDASTGKTVWSFAAGSSVNAGATIVNGIVYWGSGYAHLGIPGYTGNNKFYAFSKNGN